MLKLQFRDNRRQPISITGSVLTIGQDESNDLVLTEPGISDFHAEICAEEDGLYLVDLLSGKGTYVNDQPVSKRCKLNAWDVIRITSVELEVVDPVRRRPSDWALRAELDLLSGQFFPVQGSLLVGRGQDCDLIIDDKLLSRQHARLWLEDDELQVEDLESANGTFVNGLRIERASVRAGDEIRFDSAVFRVVGPEVQVQEDDNKTQLRPALDPDATIIQESSAQPVDATIIQESSPQPVEATIFQESSPQPVDAMTGNVERPPATADDSADTDGADENTDEITSVQSVESARHSAAEPHRPSTPVREPAEAATTQSQVSEPADATALFQATDFDADATAEFDTNEDDTSTADSEATEMLPSPAAFLIGESEPIGGQRFVLESARCMVGRSQGNDIQLLERSISGSHAQISLRDGEWSIRDMNSKNGTYLNDKQITLASLKAGDTLRFGRVEMSFSLPSAVKPADAADTLEFVGDKRKKSSVSWWFAGATVLLAAGAVLAWMILRG